MLSLDFIFCFLRYLIRLSDDEIACKHVFSGNFFLREFKAVSRYEKLCLVLSC